MEHAVIVHLRLDDSEFGSAKKRAAIIDLQDQLAEAIDNAGSGEFDGDEYGGGECVLFMYGPDADALFSSMKPILGASPLSHGGYVIKRYGEASDPKAREVRLKLQ